MPSLYEKITNQILEELECGVPPWTKKWMSHLPANFTSKTEYRGVVLILRVGYRSRLMRLLRKPMLLLLHTLTPNGVCKCSIGLSGNFTCATAKRWHFIYSKNPQRSWG